LIGWLAGGEHASDEQVFPFATSVLHSKFRLSSDLTCVVTYNWNDQTTSHTCKTDKRIRLAFSS